MRRHYLIGIAGRKGHGKDALARMIAEDACSRPNKWTIAHFAGPLKKMSQFIFGLTDAQCFSDIEKEAPLPVPIRMDEYLASMESMTGLRLRSRPDLMATTPRQILQFFGTEYVRAAAPHYWFDLLEQSIRGRTHVLVPDTRYLNEAAWLHSMGGLCIRVNRLDMEASRDSHSSEQDIDRLGVDLDLGTLTGRFEIQRRVARLINTGHFNHTKRYDYRNRLDPRAPQVVKEYYEEYEKRS